LKRDEKGTSSDPGGLREFQEFRGVGIGRDVVGCDAAGRIDFDGQAFRSGDADVLEFEVVGVTDRGRVFQGDRVREG